MSILARELLVELAIARSEKPVADILAAVDPKATRTMYREAIKMAIDDCSRSEHSYTEMADQHRMAGATLREFWEREPVSLRVIDGGTAEAIRNRWPAVEG